MKKLFRISLVVLSTVLLFSCEQSVYTGQAEEPPVQNRKIYLQSNPTNAKIYLNGKFLGTQTPDTVRWLPADANVLTLKLPLYSDTTFSVTVLSGETKSVFVDFTLNTKNVGSINCLSEPPNADIWLNDVLTNKKTPAVISRLTPGTYKVKFNAPLYRPDSANVNVSADVTTNLYLELEDTSKWVSYNKNNAGIMSNYITAIASDKLNRIWIGTEKGLMCFHGRTIDLYTSQNSPLQSENNTCIAVDDNNTIWIGTGNSLLTFDGKVWTDLSANLPNRYVSVITFDKLGSAWIGTPNGLVQYANGKWSQFFTYNSGLGDNRITSIAIDRENAIWVGTAVSGISVYDGSTWRVFNSQNIGVKNESLNYAQAIAIDNLGVVWVSSLNVYANTSVILFYNGKDWARYQMATTLTYTIAAMGHFVAFGNNKSLYVLNNDTYLLRNFFNANKELTLYRLQALAFDNYNNIWFGTSDYGFGKLKAGNF